MSSGQKAMGMHFTMTTLQSTTGECDGRQERKGFVERDVQNLAQIVRVLT